jgi:FSR family fosmidomycin resistance protein-like MFS transporter
LIGLGSTLYHPPALKAVSEVNPDKLSLAMAIQSAGGSFGFSAGPLLLGVLLPVFGWRISFYLWMPLIIITSYYSYRFISNTEKSPETRGNEIYLIKEILHQRFILIILVGALTDAAFINATTYFTTYLTGIRGLTPGFASILFGIGPLMGVFGSLFGGLLGERLGKVNAFLISIILIGVFLIIIPFTPNLLLLSVFYVLWRLFYSAFLPLMNVMVSDNSQPRTRGMAFSVFFIVSNIISAMTPGLGAYVAEVFGIESIFTMSVIMLVPGVILTSRLKYVK